MADRERCGFRIQYSEHIHPGRSGAYRVSKDGQSNIIGQAFFEDIDAASDAAFVEFMSAAVWPDFPHPFLVVADGE